MRKVPDSCCVRGELRLSSSSSNSSKSMAEKNWAKPRSWAKMPGMTSTFFKPGIRPWKPMRFDLQEVESKSKRITICHGTIPESMADSSRFGKTRTSSSADSFQDISCLEMDTKIQKMSTNKTNRNQFGVDICWSPAHSHDGWKDENCNLPTIRLTQIITMSAFASFSFLSSNGS